MYVCCWREVVLVIGAGDTAFRRELAAAPAARTAIRAGVPPLATADRKVREERHGAMNPFSLE